MLISTKTHSALESAKDLQRQLIDVASKFIPRIRDPLRDFQKRKYKFTCLDHKNEHADRINNLISLVIVETRQSQTQALKIAVEGILKKIDAPLVLICGPDNAKEICQIMQSLKCRTYKILLLEESIRSATDYNEFLMSHDFWENVYKTVKILVFQSDSSICTKSKYEISDFMNFDYIGGQWKIRRPCGLEIYGGSGGFSLRDRKLSIQSLQLFGNVPWQFGEDGFYGFFIDVLGGVVALEEEIDQFCSEKQWKEGCFAIHKLKVNINDQALIQSLADHCPDWLKIKQINY